MKVGVIANPFSGGANKLEAVCKNIMDAYSGNTIFGVSGFGGELLKGAMLLDQPGYQTSYIGRIEEAVASLLKKEIEIIIVLGGDGTAAYVADAMISKGYDVPIFGIGTGTANVGPIINTNTSDELPSLNNLKYASIGAIDILDEDKHKAYAFNDLVIGDTLLATHDGKVCTIDAAALAARGETIIKRPADVIVNNLMVKLNGTAVSGKIKHPSQIIISPITNDNFYGRAITGVLCYTPSSPYKAAVVVSERPIVSVEDDPRGFTSFAAVEQLLFTKEDFIEITGLKPSACIIADGNPYLRSGEVVRVRYVPNRITIVKGANLDGRTSQEKRP